jgi:mannitol-1-/sugar-/sorbitol-6-phosphatase
VITATAAAVLLDMDGTLVDSNEAVERIWTDWAVAHGVDAVEAMAVIHGRQGQESMAILLPDRPHEINLRENAALLHRETTELDGVVAIPGAAALLAGLANAPHALVTSATRALATARMGAAGLRMPDAAITAEDVTASKPAPDGVLAAARLLGVDPRDCVVVEDSAAGIASGLAAGMRVIGVGAQAAEAAAKGHVATWSVESVDRVRATVSEGAVVLTIG